jgi:hypothetical protein
LTKTILVDFQCGLQIDIERQGEIVCIA